MKKLKNSLHENGIMHQKDPTKVSHQNNTAAKLSIRKKSKKIEGDGLRRLFAPRFQSV